MARKPKVVEPVEETDEATPSGSYYEDAQIDRPAGQQLPDGNPRHRRDGS